MKTTRIAGIAFGILVLTASLWGCQKAVTSDFTATLQGSQVVPPVQTSATGEANFTLSSDSTQLNYTLTVKNLSNPIMAHLHMGTAGTNGAPVVWLYPSAPPMKEISGVFNGELAKGSISAAAFVGPMQGKTMADLLAAIKAGEIYVNVHTTANPNGEIRGQVH